MRSMYLPPRISRLLGRLRLTRLLHLQLNCVQLWASRLLSTSNLHGGFIMPHGKLKEMLTNQMSSNFIDKFWENLKKIEKDKKDHSRMSKVSHETIAELVASDCRWSILTLLCKRRYRFHWLHAKRYLCWCGDTIFHNLSKVHTLLKEWESEGSIDYTINIEYLDTIG